jgi:hypothetical protein
MGDGDVDLRVLARSGRSRHALLGLVGVEEVVFDFLDGALPSSARVKISSALFTPPLECGLRYLERLGFSGRTPIEVVVAVHVETNIDNNAHGFHLVTACRSTERRLIRVACRSDNCTIVSLDVFHGVSSQVRWRTASRHIRCDST